MDRSTHDAEQLGKSLTFEARDTGAALAVRALLASSEASDDWLRALPAPARAEIFQAIYRAAHESMKRSLAVLAAADVDLVRQLSADDPADGGRTPLEDPENHPVLEEIPASAEPAATPPAGFPDWGLAISYYLAKPEMPRVFPRMDSDGFVRWLFVDAACAYSHVRGLLPPVPEDALQGNVSLGGMNGFLDAGLASVRVIEGARTRHEHAHASGRVLDFGCGCGRVLRYLLGSDNWLDLHGCDVDAAAVAWCTEHLQGATFAVSDVRPPLPYPDAHFSFVYSISVFSHLSEPSQAEWIGELSRVIEPGGVLLVTTHGPSALGKMLHDANLCSSVGVSPEGARAAADEMEATGFTFVRQEDSHHDPDLYGMSFMSPSYLANAWQPQFEVVEHMEGGLQSWQDVVILRRK